MQIAVPKQTADLEKRVALTPDAVQKLIERGLNVQTERDAGAAAHYSNEEYEEAGAAVEAVRSKLFSTADILLAVQTPSEDNIKKMREGSVLICFLNPLQNEETIERLRGQNITALAMEAIPRISRAQSMDALSTMSSISGYKAALIGANYLDRYMPMMMTAAGTIPPAKVLVLGAGVAGLQAIATAKRLGAAVEAFDIRPAVKEQVESLGAKFVEVPETNEDTETAGGYAKELSEDKQERQRQVIHEHVKKSDIVLTTALIPGKSAPLLITEEMVQDMHSGGVIVDLAAEQGGNCQLTEAGETFDAEGVKIIGPLNLPSTLAHHASRLYSKNLMSLLDHLLNENDELDFDFEGEIILNTTITHGGEMISPILKDT